jgi:hypothetical protein
MPASKLEDLLKSSKNSDLKDLVGRAEAMGSLTQMLSAALPPELAGAIVAANVRAEGELVVICSSSAWASRIRFENSALLEAASSHGHQVTHLTVRVSTS